MGKIFVTSDLHFGHDRGFLYEPRGFKNIEDHDETVIANWNNVVSDEDDVYVLGDLMLNDNEHGVECIKRLKGKIHIVYGNHDTDARKALYNELGVVVHGWADVIKYRKYHFYLSHYPTMTGNLEAESLHQCAINLFGHTHQQFNFYQDIPFMYHVGCDSHNNTPVLLDDIIDEIKAKVYECKEML
jgi:calcineurin-like phosphoesterase family protein